MNPSKLNHRLKFSQLTESTNDYGGQEVTQVPLVVSTGTDTDTTWASVEPIKQWQTLAIQAGASVMTEDRIVVLRYRNLFGPDASLFFIDTIFEDLNNPGSMYTIHSVLPYQPGSKTTFQNTDAKPFKDNVWVFMVAKKRV